MIAEGLLESAMITFFALGLTLSIVGFFAVVSWMIVDTIWAYVGDARLGEIYGDTGREKHE